MSQPSENTMSFPNQEQNGSFRDQEKFPNDGIKQYPNGNNKNFGYPPRPSLNRIDSRGSFPVGPGYSNPSQGPPVARQPVQQIRPSPPPPGSVFATRPPGVPSRPPFLPPFSSNQNNPNLQFQNQSNNPNNPNIQFQNQTNNQSNPNNQFQSQVRPGGPNFRPGVPFQSRGPAPGQYRPPLLPQTSDPISEQQTSENRSFLARSQTLDSTGEANNSKPSPGNANNLRNHSSNMNNVIASSNSVHSSNSNLNEEIQQRNMSRSGSIEGKNSISNSVESLDKKSENEYSSRPESRNAPRSQILDNQRPVDSYNKPSNESNSRPESRNSMVTSKPPIPSTPNTINKTEEINVPKTPNKETRKQSPEIEKRILNLEDSKKGDNDSGVDESMQGNDQSSNGDTTSPRNSASKPPKRIPSATPSKSRSLSRDSKSPLLKSPDSQSAATTPGATEKKKLPMNKIQVGSAPSPNLKEVRSKIGSLQNTTHKPGGGKVKIENKKIELKNVTPRIEAKNDKYAPKGGERKIISQKLQWNAKSKIGSLENASHKPISSGKKIETVKLDFKEKAKPKVGSKDNIKYVPGGGDVKNEEINTDVARPIETKKIEVNVQSKIGSFDNVKHKPKGGDKKIFDDKDYLRQMSDKASENHSLSGSQADDYLYKFY